MNAVHGWMQKELQNPFARDTYWRPVFWHKSQIPDWVGLSFGLIPHCMEQNSSQMLGGGGGDDFQIDWHIRSFF